MKKINWKLLLTTLVIVSYPWLSQGADPTEDHLMTWDNPTTYTDGSLIAPGDLITNKIKHGTQSGIYSDVLTFPTTTSYLMTNIPVGKHYYVVTVTPKNGAESDPSNEIVITVVDDRKSSACATFNSTRIR